MTKPAHNPKLGAQLKYFYPMNASIFRLYKLIFCFALKDNYQDGGGGWIRTNVLRENRFTVCRL